MIARDAEPIGHIPVYRRIDLSNPGRRAVITVQQVEATGGKGPDPALYNFDYYRDAWVLK